MNKNQPTGKQKKSVPKKVDGKALEIVPPNAAGIDVGGNERYERKFWPALASRMRRDRMDNGFCRTQSRSRRDSSDQGAASKGLAAGSPDGKQSRHDLVST
jgi:hypothetical protein